MYSDQKMLRRVYFQSLFPNLIAILGGTVNVLFDGILVGQRLGELGIASINQSLAVYLFLCTMGSLIAAGASASSASAIGASRVQEGQEYYSLAVELALVCGILFCGLGYLLSDLIARFLGAEDSWKLVSVYIRIMFAGGVFKVLLYIPFFYLRLAGKNRQSAAAMLTMMALNVALDYVFLFLFDWGIGGAAWASTIATAAACAMGFQFMRGKGQMFRFKPIGIKREYLVTVIKSGSPMAANNLFSALRIICLNGLMNAAGGSDMVAIFAITNSLNEFSISIQNGVPQAGSAVFGISYGEKDTVSVKWLLRLQIWTGFCLSMVFSVLLIAFGGRIGYLFGSSLDIRFAVCSLAAGIVLGTLNSVMAYYYYATMKSGMANLIMILRVFAVTVPVAWLLRGLSDGIWMFYWLSELITAAIWIGAVFFHNKSAGESGLYMLDESVMQEGKCINFTVACSEEEICEASEKIQTFCQKNTFDQEQTMTISLALEELMIIIADKSMNHQGTMDVRLLRTEEGGILRIRSEGKRYNPLDYAEESLDFLGVSLIMKMAKRTEYQSVLGFNTLIVFI